MHANEASALTSSRWALLENGVLSNFLGFLLPFPVSTLLLSALPLKGPGPPPLSSQIATTLAAVAVPLLALLSPGPSLARTSPPQPPETSPCISYQLLLPTSRITPEPSDLKHMNHYVQCFLWVSSSGGPCLRGGSGLGSRAVAIRQLKLEEGHLGGWLRVSWSLHVASLCGLGWASSQHGCHRVVDLFTLPLGAPSLSVQ